MANYFSFPSQAASEECPAIPHGVKVWGDAGAEKTKSDLGAALAILARALKNDPKLEKIHPEFLSPEDAKTKVKAT